MSLFRMQCRLLRNVAGIKTVQSIKLKNNNFTKDLGGAYSSLVSTNNYQYIPQRYFNIFSVKNNNADYVNRMMHLRSIATHEITKNIQIFSDRPFNVDHDPITLKLKSPPKKPMVLLFSWLLAKQTHLTKYAKLYTDEGYDVLCIQISPWQLLWPAKGSQIVARDVLKFLENNLSYNPLLIHGFSVGAYVFGECLVQMTREYERYKVIFDRITGQIWDSAADITEIPIGVPKAVFPKNKTLENALQKYMLYHLKVFHEQATIHYIRSSQIFTSSHLRAPALILTSKTDPVGAVSSNNRIRESWESLGIKVQWKCWEKSPHVTHFLTHREEYIEEMSNFLRSLNMPHLEKVQAKSKL